MYSTRCDQSALALEPCVRGFDYHGDYERFVLIAQVMGGDPTARFLNVSIQGMITIEQSSAKL